MVVVLLWGRVVQVSEEPQPELLNELDPPPYPHQSISKCDLLFSALGLVPNSTEITQPRPFAIILF